MKSIMFDKLSFLSLFLVLVLLPVFFLPFTNFPVETSKGLLLVAGLTISLVFWIIARFIDGKIVFPKSWLLLSMLGVVVTVLLSALLSSNPQVSMFGTMFDIGSFWFIFSGFILMLMSSVVFNTPQKAKIVLLGVILSSAVILVFQSFHLFLPAISSFGILTEKTSNVLGSWNALGIFSGFASLTFLFVVEFFPISRLVKLMLQVFIGLSILLAAAINFPLVWMLLGISSLIIFVYKTSINYRTSEGDEDRKQFPMVSFAVMIISLLFFTSGQFIGNVIPNRLQISNTEVSPSFISTLSVTKDVLKQDPVFGLGPNRFGQAWSMYKPASINNSQFWDISFESGFGLFPTLFSTVGGLGILAWIIFFVLFLLIGVKSVFSGLKSGVNWEMMAFFVLSLYLYVSLFFYFPGSVIFLLSLAFTGVFIGLAASNSGKEISMSFLDDHRKSFFSILALVVILASSFVGAFKYIERFASITYFGESLKAETIALSESYIGRALSLHSNDLYLRTYSQIYLVKLGSIANKGAELSEEDKASLQASFDQAINGAQMAVVYNPSNYLNLQSLGSVYQAVGSIGVEDAYTRAFEAYQSASTLNPLSPGLKLSMGNVMLLDGKKQEAKDYANQALTLKPDYIDALITLSQIASSEGKTAEAISYAKTALSFAPNNQNLIQYVNSLSRPSSQPQASDEDNESNE